MRAARHAAFVPVPPQSSCDALHATIAALGEGRADDDAPLEAELSELRSRLEAVEAPIVAEVAELRARLDFVERSSDGADRVHRAQLVGVADARLGRERGPRRRAGLADGAARRGPPPGSRRALHQTGPREAVVVLRDGRRIPLRRRRSPTTCGWNNVTKTPLLLRRDLVRQDRVEPRLAVRDLGEVDDERA